MTYDEARELIPNGSVIFFSGGKRNLTRRLITLFSDGPHYHVGIAVWMKAGGKRRLMLAESQPDGFRMVTLGSYSDRNMTVIQHPGASEQVIDMAIESSGRIPYDYTDMVAILFRERLGIKVPEWATSRGDVCSVFVSKILQKAGVLGIDTLVSPEKLLTQLKEIAPVFLEIESKSSVTGFNPSPSI